MIGALAAIAGALAGAGFCAAALGRRRPWLSRVELAFLAATAGLGVLMASGLVLAEFGVFRTPLLAVILIIFAAAAVLAFGKAPRSHGPPASIPRWPAALAALAVVYATASTWGASDLILGGADPGTYVAIAGNLAREGTVYHGNSAIASLPDGVADALMPRADGRFMELSGMVADPKVKGRTNPQFLHGFPALLAVFREAFGILGMLRVPVIAHVLSILGVFLLGWRLFASPVAGSLASLLLATNLAQLYYGRTPFSEVPNQLFFVAAAWLLTLALQHADRTLAVLSASMWTMACVVRPDAYLAPAALFVGIAMMPPDASAEPIRRPFTWSLAGGVLGAAALTSITSWNNYFRNTLPETLGAWALVLVTGAVCLLAPTLWRTRFFPAAWNAVYRRASLAGWLLTVLLFGVLAWGYWIRPTLTPVICDDPATCLHNTGMRTYDEDTFVRLAWYLSPVGLVLAAVGAAGLIRQHLRSRDFVLLPFLAVGLAFSALFLWHQMNSPWHFWAFRRYVPAVLPFAALCIAWTLANVASAHRRAWIAATVLALYLCAFGLRMSLPFLKTREMEGAREQVRTIARRLPPGAVLLGTSPLGNSLLLLPLQALFGFDVVRFPQVFPDADALEKALSAWTARGRPVVFICEPEAQCFWPADGWHIQRRFEATIDVQRARSTFDRAPSQFERLYVGYVAYDVAQGRAAQPPVSWDRAGDHLGFHSVEEWNGQRYRWTSGDAELRVGIPAGTDEIGLFVAANGPASVPLTVSLDGEGRKYELEPGFDKIREVKMPLPERRGRSIVLRLRSPVFQPSQSGSTDPRQLGVALFSVRVGHDILQTSAGEP